MPETAKRTARVPILGEDGRISDDYIPAAIGEGVESAEAAATRAETAATAAEGFATAASQSATDAQGSASAASASAIKAQQSATAASGAVTKAQSAQQAAEAAKTAAETAQSAAAGSAQDAQQSATAAEDSAASVADKFIASAQATTLEPGSQATASVADQVLTLGIPRGDKGDKGDQGEKGDTGTGVPDGGTPGQLLSKTADGTAWVDPPSGNVLTGEAEGYVAHAEDAYAQKPREVRIKGRTVQNLWVNKSVTAKGITVTSNDDGSVTLSGTSTSKSDVYIQTSIYTVKPNTAYTLSIDKTPSGFSIYGQEYNGSTFFDSCLAIGAGSTILYSTATTSESGFDHMNIMFNVKAGVTVSGTYRIMLNEGSTAKPWCPPGLNSVDELSIVTAGKNLFPNISGETSNGITISGNSVDGYTLSGTASANTFFYTSRVYEIPKGVDVTLSLGNSKVNTYVSAYCHNSYASPNIVAVTAHTVNASSSSVTFDVIKFFGIRVESGAVLDGFTIKPQLELGSTATAYEPPAVTTTPIDLDGNTLCSLPDGTHDELTIDATGAVTLTKRVCVVDYEASDFNSAPSKEFAETGLSKPYAGGVDFSRHKQRSGFASIDNADIVAGYPMISVYTQGTRTALRGGTGFTEASTNEQLTKFKTLLGSATWHHLYALAAPETISLPPVTLPTLPAPTVNVWADAEASGAGYAMDPDVALEYERDVTIAFNKLQAQISATTVREATNG